MPRGKSLRDPNTDTDSELVNLSVSELKTLMRNIAAEVFDAKKEKLRTEIEDECEYQVYIQSEEIEKTFEKFKKELKKKGETVEYRKVIKDQCDESLKSCNQTLMEEIKSRDEEIDALKKENLKMKRSLKKIQFHLSCKDAKIEELKLKLDQVEQYQYDRNVRIIVGLPEVDGESDAENIQKMARTKLEMSVEKSDIVESYRLGKINNRKKTRDLIVKFKKKSTRDQFYNNRKKLTPNDEQQNVYINDQLTEHRASIFYEARNMVKAKKLHSAWTQRGNILIRNEDSDKPKQISSFKQLAEILGEVHTEDIYNLESSDEED